MTVALITGGGTGIGRATALALARDGARVVICGRREEPLAETEAELAALGAECLTRVTDIREPEQADALVDDALGAFGQIDVLVNNAGGQFTAPAEEITLKGWRAVHRLSVDAVWNLTRTVAVRSMIPGAGGVIFFNAFSPRRGLAGFAHAAAARAAVENWPAAWESSGAATASARSRWRSAACTPRRTRPTGTTWTSRPRRSRCGASAPPRTWPP